MIAVRRALLALAASLLLAGCWQEDISPAEPKASAPPSVQRPAPTDAPQPSPRASREVPTAALRHRADLTRNARAVWGLDAPVAVLAAQVHQESGWREAVRSPAGALGMAQFMPATAKWIAQAYPSLAAPDPMNPSWALRAMVTYDRHLWERVSAADDCHRWAMALSAYNGGLGWISRDKAVAASQGLDPSRWWEHVETVNAGRSASNWRENRGYPVRILRQLAPLYASWGQGVCP